MKKRLLPLALTLLLLLLPSKDLAAFFASIFALLLHETGHYVAARRRGFVPEGFSLTPFGATMSFDCGLSGADDLVVTLAGPVANLLFCPLLVALWWVCPALYAPTKALFYADFFLAAYNLLPVVPFDGGRLLLALSSDKKRTFRFLKKAGIIIAALFFVSGTVSVVFHRGTLPFLAAATVLYFTLFPPENEKYRLVFDQLALFSTHVTERKDLFVLGETTLKKLLRKINKSDVFYVVHVAINGAPTSDVSLPTDKEIPVAFSAATGCTSYLLYGARLRALFYKDRNLTVKESLFLTYGDADRTPPSSARARSRIGFSSLSFLPPRRSRR